MAGRWCSVIFKTRRFKIKARLAEWAALGKKPFYMRMARMDLVELLWVACEELSPENPVGAYHRIRSIRRDFLTHEYYPAFETGSLPKSGYFDRGPKKEKWLELKHYFDKLSEEEAIFLERRELKKRAMAEGAEIIRIGD